jgi:hypothetical protein
VPLGSPDLQRLSHREAGNFNPLTINLVRGSSTLATTGSLSSSGTDFTETSDANA